MVVLHTLTALVATAAVSMASPLHKSSWFSIPDPVPLAMYFGGKVTVVPYDINVTLTSQPPRLGTFQPLSGSSYTVVTVQPYDTHVNGVDSNLLWLQTGLKPSAIPTKFETSTGFYRVYELHNEDNKPVFAWSPSNLQSLEYGDVFTFLLDSSNISPQDELDLQTAALNPERFGLRDMTENIQLEAVAGTIFFTPLDSAKKPSSAEKTTYATLPAASNLSEGAQAPLFNGRRSEASASLKEPETIEVPVIHEAQDRAATATSTENPPTPTFYPMIMETGCPDAHSSASHNRMHAFGLVLVAAMLFAL
ncbi:hypothetical protein B0T13DRAFT_531477 [Neurospora crassa]|nr:hypothetical protein B0T13DRAFT_531477 [Neurospora crassa]